MRQDWEALSKAFTKLFKAIAVELHIPQLVEWLNNIFVKEEDNL